MEKDKKYQDCWRRAVLCRTDADFKESILEACPQRNDDIANNVRVEVEGALSDLHAADARYHVHRMANSCLQKSIPAPKNASNEDGNTDTALVQVIGEMSKR